MGRRFDSFRARQCLEFSIYNSVAVAVAQLAESWIVIPVVVGSSPTSHPILIKSITLLAGVAKLVDAPDLGSGAFGVRVRVSSPAPL